MSIIVNGILCIGIIAGSFSIGALFLRIGWPKVKTFDEEYRKGWALAMGLIFAFATIGGSLLLWFMIPAYSYSQILLEALVFGFAIGIVVTTARRKMAAIDKVNVEIPKDKAASIEISNKAVEMLKQDKKFIKVAKTEEKKLLSLREKIGIKEPEKEVAAEEREEEMLEEKPAKKEMPVEAVKEEHEIAEAEEKAEAEETKEAFAEEEATIKKEENVGLAEKQAAETAEKEVSAEEEKPEKEKFAEQLSAENEVEEEHKEISAEAEDKIAKEEKELPLKEAKDSDEEKRKSKIDEAKKMLLKAVEATKKEKQKEEEADIGWPEETNKEEESESLSPLQELLKKKRKELNLIKKGK